MGDDAADTLDVKFLVILHRLTCIYSISHEIHPPTPKSGSSAFFPCACCGKTIITSRPGLVYEAQKYHGFTDSRIDLVYEAQKYQRFLKNCGSVAALPALFYSRPYHHFEIEQSCAP
ncbi:hypothetical protein CSKR_110212 [Clonorchis sinensis]|uniref:Uncharacterized protein n=1 Tax=Clonorchis sinensis TaxID=79923 RepID=A0A419PR85_CLOSI|nr:hypothetical protein CSKR_110212 [Clonorchis sinensis]